MEAEKMDEAKIKSAVAHFEALVREQYERSDRIKADKDFIDYDKLDKIISRIFKLIKSSLAFVAATVSARSLQRNPPACSNTCSRTM
jgi:hypothetical protein